MYKNTKKIIKARNVLFKEDDIKSFSAKENSRPEESILESPNIDLDNESSNYQTTEKPVEDDVGGMERQSQIHMKKKHHFSPRPPERYDNPFTFKTTQEETVTEPKTYKDAAVSSTQAKYWKQAMQAEFESLENNNILILVQEPKDRKVLPGKWVYKVKYGADGQIDKYKANT